MANKLKIRYFFQIFSLIELFSYSFQNEEKIFCYFPQKHILSGKY
jgi:hypothetical protein